MYPNVVCKTSDKSIANYRKNKMRCFKAPFSVLTNNNGTSNLTHKQFLYVLKLSGY